MFNTNQGAVATQQPTPSNILNNNSSLSLISSFSSSTNTPTGQLTQNASDLYRSRSLSTSTPQIETFHSIGLIPDTLKKLCATISQKNSNSIDKQDLKNLKHQTRLLIESNQISVSDLNNVIFTSTLQYSNDPTSPKVIRIGINPSVLTEATHYHINYNELHYIEELIFEQAFKELKGQKSAEKYHNDNDFSNFPGNVVIVDIFVRGKGEGRIQPFSATRSFPQTHSIVLWKRQDTKIVVIDPNQKSFSQYIINILKDGNYNRILSGIDVESMAKDAIYATQQSQNSNTSNFTPRDCIDIAIKISFEINEQQKSGLIFSEIEQKMYEQISNIAKSNSKLLKPLDTTFAQDLQSSDKNIRHKAKISLQEIDLILLKNQIKSSPIFINNNMTDIAKTCSKTSQASP